MTPDAGIAARARNGDPVALTRRLVAVPSVNPSLEPGGTGEARIAETTAEWLRDWGFEVRVDEVEEGRINVVAVHGSGSPGLLLNGHLDTVGVEGMTIPPFEPELVDGRIRGRGSCDMKAGLAAILAAARHVAGSGHEGTLTVAFTADEEHASIGMEALAEEDPPADAAVICEPTGLAVMPAHRGFVWVDLVFRGRAAHGSRPDLGVDAIRHAGHVLAGLDDYEVRLGERRRHPLLDGPSVHAGTIRGGSAPSVYPAECRLVVERRTLPGEEPDDVLEELREVVERVRSGVADLDASLTLGLHRPGTEVPDEAPVVRGLLRSCEEEGTEPRVGGMPAWVDAALLNAIGIPTVCFGPGSIDQAHTADEWVPAREVEKAARILERFTRRFLAEAS